MLRSHAKPHAELHAESHAELHAKPHAGISAGYAVGIEKRRLLNRDGCRGVDGNAHCIIDADIVHHVDSEAAITLQRVGFDNGRAPGLVVDYLHSRGNSAGIGDGQRCSYACGSRAMREVPGKR